MRPAPPKHNRSPHRDDDPYRGYPGHYDPDLASDKPGINLNPWRLWRLLTQTVASGILVAGLVVGIGMWKFGDRFFEGLRLMVTPQVEEPKPDVRSVVVQQLRGASELTTAIFAMEAVVPTKSDRTLGGYVIGSTNLLYIAYGEVRAGVDLSEITATDIQLNDAGDRPVQVTLPPPRILDSKLDLNRSDVYDYDRGFLGLGPDNAPDLQEAAQKTALSKIVQAACSEGILQEANSRARLTVAQILSTAGLETVEVKTQPGDAALCANPTIDDTVD
jgi:hypothetical protein